VADGRLGVGVEGHAAGAASCLAGALGHGAGGGADVLVLTVWLFAVTDNDWGREVASF